MINYPQYWQIVDMKGEIPPNKTPRTDNYISDTNNTSEDDKYPWLDTADKKWNMTNRSFNVILTLKSIQWKRTKI